MAALPPSRPVFRRIAAPAADGVLSRARGAIRCAPRGGAFSTCGFAPLSGRQHTANRCGAAGAAIHPRAGRRANRVAAARASARAFSLSGRASASHRAAAPDGGIAATGRRARLFAPFRRPPSIALGVGGGLPHCNRAAAAGAAHPRRRRTAAANDSRRAAGDRVRRHQGERAPPPD